MNPSRKVDFHMHSVVSDGTDSPAELLEKVRQIGLDCFALTDHDDVKGCRIIRSLLQEGDPPFIPGVEFSCKDEEGKYHILGYGFDPQSEPIREMVETCHRYRMDKVRGRLELLGKTFGFTFPAQEIESLLSLDNPGKPHIGNLMVKYGYAGSKEQAIKEYINEVRFPGKHVRPEHAISSIIAGGGIPVLAHPSYGSGDELILGDEMDERIRRLKGFGLRGLEAFYSGFTPQIRNEILSFADRYDMLVTAGSDYHGTNKMVVLGDTGLSDSAELPEGLCRFLSDCF